MTDDYFLIGKKVRLRLFDGSCYREDQDYIVVDKILCDGWTKYLVVDQYDGTIYVVSHDAIARVTELEFIL